MHRRAPLQPRQLSWANKLGRALWGMVWFFLFRPTPRPLHRWRCLLLRVFGARIGKGVSVYPSARIWAPWNLEMDDNSRLGDFVDCYCVDQIRISKEALVSQYTFLCTASHDYTDECLPLITAPIEIGPRAWVAADVFVGPGVTIGQGAMVTARSSVFQDIEPWVVATGNPAQRMRPRTMKAANKAGASESRPRLGSQF